MAMHSSRSIIIAILLPLLWGFGVYGALWEYSLEHDSHHHRNQYHERFNEAAIRNVDDRLHHQEEYAEYATRYAETAREHEHDRYEAVVRREEQHHENHETTRENHWNSREMIPRGISRQVIDERRAKKFLRSRRSLFLW